MGVMAIVLLACALVLVVGAEWPRLSAKVGAEGNDALRRRLGLMLGTSSGASGRGAASYSVGA